MWKFSAVVQALPLHNSSDSVASVPKTVTITLCSATYMIKHWINQSRDIAINFAIPPLARGAAQNFRYLNKTPSSRSVVHVTDIAFVHRSGRVNLKYTNLVYFP